MITEQTLEDFLETQYTIEHEANELLEMVHDIDPIDGYSHLQFQNVECGTINFKGVDNWRGGRDEYDHELPEELLHSQSVRDGYFESLKDKVNDRIQKQLELKNKQQRKTDEKELEQYNKLKLKFGETK